jgi:hypothetical protein
MRYDKNEMLVETAMRVREKLNIVSYSSTIKKFITQNREQLSEMDIQKEVYRLGYEPENQTYIFASKVVKQLKIIL